MEALIFNATSRIATVTNALGRKGNNTIEAFMHNGPLTGCLGLTKPVKSAEYSHCHREGMHWFSSFTMCSATRISTIDQAKGDPFDPQNPGQSLERRIVLYQPINENLFPVRGSAAQLFSPWELPKKDHPPQPGHLNFMSRHSPIQTC